MVLSRFRDLEIDADDIADSRAIVYLENINTIINKKDLSDSKKIEKIKEMIDIGLIDELYEEMYVRQAREMED